MSIPWRKFGATKIATLVIGTLVILLIGLWITWGFPVGTIDYATQPIASNTDNDPSAASTGIASSTENDLPSKPIVTHLPTPDPLKAVYITACTASERRLRDKVVSLFSGSELNAIIIDIKDYTGTLAYSSSTLRTGRTGNGCVIIDLPEFLHKLHEKGIYTIARVTVFQDPLYAEEHPESAIKKVSNPQALWRDPKGLAYIDPGAVPFWDYIVNISKEAYSIGFDEINYDYIRFPSDGDLKDMKLLPEDNRPVHVSVAASISTPTSASTSGSFLGAATTTSAGQKINTGQRILSYETSKSRIITEFFKYLKEHMADTPVKLSADLFGLTTSAESDLGIGQILENALPYFDYVCPMVYPSHFAYGFIGIPRPATKPYEVISYSMSHAIMKVDAASSTPSKLRPWLQAFDLGAVYTPAMVEAEKQAVYDSGLSSWSLWNAGSIYTSAELAPATKMVTYKNASTSAEISASTATTTVR
ncbi:hypothetical protein KGQ27_02785 [Patescibacteria group bacterium]|nr:hypothetical protein [Patescibacteria group bacterium]MDE1946794.1 hypothetical protein [Patescibacteria group bacterium]MDE2011074.1 hypothetical protein [Patescibacteria group bacterium]MDE2233131.1 hypothetical protein [Patescibacteria group bacterium]